MKYFYIFLFFSVAAISQTNFSIESNKVKWQKVYDSQLSENQIKTELKQNPVLTQVAESLSGESNPIEFSCEKSMPIYMRDEFTFYAIVEIKDGRYRITVSNFRMIPSTTWDLGGVETTNKTNAFGDYIIKNNEFKTNRLSKRVLNCIDEKLTNLFSFQPANQDW